MNDVWLAESPPGPSRNSGSSGMTHFLRTRRKPSHIFQLCYTDLCSLHNIPMIFSIKAHLHKRVLDFNGDRVKLDEWRPILKALSLDRSLHLIAIRSKNSCSKVLEHIDSETKSRKVIKLPVLLTNFIFKRLVTSLSRCLNFNSHLKCLELDGLLLSGDYLQVLLHGLEKSSSLQHLSLHRCPLGDDGCRLVCNTLKNLPNVLTIDMSGCNISQKGAYYIAKALQFQNLNRHGENWKQSLRYRTPDTDVMPGLRRVTLNHNPSIGDSGAGLIITVLRDDLWLKALDLQNVGLTNRGAQEVLDLLSVNKSLVVLDVHNNPDMDRLVFESIMHRLAANNLGKTSEYHWMQEGTLYLPRKPTYQSRDPSFVQRSLKDHDAANTESHLPSESGAVVRLTKSSTIPRGSAPPVLVTKTRSSSAVITHDAKTVERKSLRGHLFGIKQNSMSKSASRSRWDHGDGAEIPDIRANLQELSSKLEEEIQKRVEAEKQKADLELKLEKLSQKQNGQILVDENVLKEITEAFAVFSCFVDIFSKGGLHLGTANSSEQLSVQVISDTPSTSSLSLSPYIDFDPEIEKDCDEASSLHLNLASLNVHDWRSECTKSVPASETKAEQHSECKRGNSGLVDQPTVEGETAIFLGNKFKESPQCRLHKVLDDIIFQIDHPTIVGGHGHNMPNTNDVSCTLNRQSKLSPTVLMKSSTITSPKREDQTESSFGLHTESKESLYTNAEQNDQEDGWVTESGDASQCSTLTELNMN